MDSLKIKPKPRPTSQVLKSKALNKAKMIIRKLKSNTATDDDLGEAIELMRLINEPPKPGTEAYALLLGLRNLVQEKKQEQRQEAREAPETTPSKPPYLH